MAIETAAAGQGGKGDGAESSRLETVLLSAKRYGAPNELIRKASELKTSREVYERDKQLRELQKTCGILEDDNQTLKDCVDALEQQVVELKKELKAAKAKAKAANRREPDVVEEFAFPFGSND